MRLRNVLPLFLLATAPSVWADVCVAPGDTVITDPTGDVAILGLVPVPANPGADVLDLVSLSIATPPADSIDSQTVVFTITTNGDNPLGFPPGSGYYSSFVDPRKLIRGVRAVGNDSGELTFFSYVASESQGGFIDGRFIAAGSEAPAEGSYADGVMTITVKAKDIGVRNSGDVLSGFNAGSVAFIGADGTGAADVPDGMPDDLQARGASAPIVYAPCSKGFKIGETVLTDPAGDDLVGAGDPISGSFDLLSLAVGYTEGASLDEQKVVFTLDTTASPAFFTPGSGIFTSFVDPRKLIRGVRAEGDMAGDITFFSYVVAVDNDGEFGGQFIEDGSQKAVEGSIADGVITFTMPAKDLGIRDVCDVISGFNAGGILLAGAPGAASVSFNVDAMPETLTDRAVALPVSNPACGKTSAPKAVVAKEGSGLLAGSLNLLTLLLPLLLALRRRRV